MEYWSEMTVTADGTLTESVMDCFQRLSQKPLHLLPIVRSVFRVLRDSRVTRSEPASQDLRCPFPLIREFVPSPLCVDVLPNAQIRHIRHRNTAGVAGDIMQEKSATKERREDMYLESFDFGSCLSTQCHY
eukprot:scaffold42493_cov28-Attheya_sp.AAC.1